VLPLATLWRIARRDLATRIRGLRLLAVCLFLGVATLAAIGSLTRGNRMVVSAGADKPACVVVPPGIARRESMALS